MHVVQELSFTGEPTFNICDFYARQRLRLLFVQSTLTLFPYMVHHSS
jgi:hypothetical protein